MSFPIALQATTNDESNNQIEIDLIAELAGSVIDFTSGLIARLQIKKRNQQMSSSNGMILTEDQKILLAHDPRTSADVLSILGNDNSSAVRNELIFNPMTPSAVLIKLASDSDHFVSAQARTKISMAA